MYVALVVGECSPYLSLRTAASSSTFPCPCWATRLAVPHLMVEKSCSLSLNPRLRARDQTVVDCVVLTRPATVLSSSAKWKTSVRRNGRLGETAEYRCLLADRWCETTRARAGDVVSQLKVVPVVRYWPARVAQKSWWRRLGINLRDAEKDKRHRSGSQIQPLTMNCSHFPCMFTGSNHE